LLAGIGKEQPVLDEDPDGRAARAEAHRAAVDHHVAYRAATLDHPLSAADQGPNIHSARAHRQIVAGEDPATEQAEIEDTPLQSPAAGQNSPRRYRLRLPDRSAVQGQDAAAEHGRADIASAGGDSLMSSIGNALAVPPARTVRVSRGPRVSPLLTMPEETM
jgi:hypothetical protein